MKTFMHLVLSKLLICTLLCGNIIIHNCLNFSSSLQPLFINLYIFINLITFLQITLLGVVILSISTTFIQIGFFWLWNLCFPISILPNVLFYPFLYMMRYISNDRFFTQIIKPVFLNKFAISFSVIPTIIQQ